MKIKRYWLMKSEPGCFSIDDLQARPSGIEHWDGVRNYQARNLLRDDIQVGDGVLFYHSNTADPAIVGLAKVTRAGYPDHTAFDPTEQHFDPASHSDNPRWYMVDVQYLCHLPFPLTRSFLAEHPLLSGMGVMKKGNRLSVQPVLEREWRAVLDIAGIADPLG